MIKVGLVIQYITVVVQYYLIYDLLFKEKVRRYYIPAIGGAVYTIVVLVTPIEQYDVISVCMYPISIVCFFLAQITKEKKRVARIVIIAFLTECLGLMLVWIGRTIWENDDHVNPIANIGTIVNLLIIIIVLIINHVVGKLSSEQIQKIKSFISRRLIVLVILMSMVLLFTIEGLDLARNNSDSQMFKNIAGIFIGLSYGSVGLLGIFMIYIHRTNEKINGLLDVSKKLGILQKQHYESLLEKEEETKKYRHDMMNHMVYMNGLAKKKEPEKIYEYINELMTELETIQKKRINTGNDVIDIMTNYYIELLDQKVSISVTGEINPKMDDLKLCIIYGNILQNAIEELAQCGTDAWLRIRLEQGREYCVITIENSLSGEIGKKRIQSDLKDHGIGLQNVKLAVEELNGKIETKKGENYYHISVSLPL